MLLLVSPVSYCMILNWFIQSASVFMGYSKAWKVNLVNCVNFYFPVIQKRCESSHCGVTLVSTYIEWDRGVQLQRKSMNDDIMYKSYMSRLYVTYYVRLFQPGLAVNFTLNCHILVESTRRQTFACNLMYTGHPCMPHIPGEHSSIDFCILYI